MHRVYGSVVAVNELGKIFTKNIDAGFEIGCLLYLTDYARGQQVTEWEYITLILRKIDFFLKNDRRYAEFDAENMITGLVKAFNRIVTGQEAVTFHGIPLIGNLHYIGVAQVDEVGIAHIGKLGIRKATRVLLPEAFKAGFPEKLHQVSQPLRRRNPMVMLVKMVNMDKFYMPDSHSNKDKVTAPRTGTGL